MDKGQPLTSSVDATIVVLAAEAKDGRLAICAGAGISMPGLPDGKQLARLIDERFQGVTGYACAEPDDLLRVADAAAGLGGGLEAVQRVVLELAPFSTVAPRLAHRLLALLLAEDAIRLLLTNWDDCVERSWREFEHIEAARNEVEAERLRGQFVLKIHGCCTQSETLLITSAQLCEAPLWTKIYFGEALARSTMVFVGIGDVADYAQKRISELAELVEHARVRVVSPNIATNWTGSDWEKLLPDLPVDRRIAMTADAFLDELAREWVMQLIREVKNAPTTGAAPWLEAVTDAFVYFTAAEALVWLRQAAVDWEVGESVVRTSGAPSALEALGLLARTPGSDVLAPIRFVPSSAALVGDARFDVLICRARLTPSEIEQAAKDRAQRVAQRLGPQPSLHLLLAASSVRGPKPRLLPAVDIIDVDTPVDALIGGDRQIPIELTYVDEVLEAA